MTKQQRFWILVFAAIAIVSLFVLAAGVSGFELLPGHPLPRREQTQQPLGNFLPDVPGSGILGLVFAGLFFLAILLMPLAIVYFLVSPEARRRVLRSLSLLLWILAIYLIMRNRPDLFRDFQQDAAPTPLLDDVEIPSVEFVANPPPWLVTSVTVGVALLIAAVIVGGAWVLWRRRRQASPLDELAGQAQVAIEALQAGADVKDTVMRCYFDMSRVLSEERGLRRAEDMTPREFEARLTAAGLPQAQIEQLTRLFERVRYGTRAATAQEEQQAIACLAAVVEASRGAS